MYLEGKVIKTKGLKMSQELKNQRGVAMIGELVIVVVVAVATLSVAWYANHVKTAPQSTSNNSQQQAAAPADSPDGASAAIEQSASDESAAVQGEDESAQANQSSGSDLEGSFNEDSF
jgi:Tfp pilus assembly protein PilV